MERYCLLTTPALALSTERINEWITISNGVGGGGWGGGRGGLWKDLGVSETELSCNSRIQFENFQGRKSFLCYFINANVFFYEFIPRNGLWLISNWLERWQKVNRVLYQILFKFLNIGVNADGSEVGIENVYLHMTIYS